MPAKNVQGHKFQLSHYENKTKERVCAQYTIYFMYKDKIPILLMEYDWKVISHILQTI